MILKTDDKSIIDIFKPNKEIRWIIPKYQREYEWKRSHCEDLFIDLYTNDKGYFLGTILCVEVESEKIFSQEFEIIDGQQRLASLSLLYIAIYKQLDHLIKIKFPKPDIDNKEFLDLTLEKKNIKNMIILNDEKKKLKLRLSSQNDNDRDYFYIISKAGIIESSEAKPRYFGLRRLSKRFELFKEKISEMDLDELLRYKENLDNALLVVIQAKSHSDAFVLFESLNNRGLELTAMDLIKNKLLGEIERNGKYGINMDKAFEKWKIILNNLKDNKAQERLLRHYYNAFKYKKEVGLSNISRATRSNLIKIYEKYVEKNPINILNELIDKSHIYKYLVYPEKLIDREETDKTYLNFYKPLKNLDLIGGNPSRAFLLYLLSEHSNKDDLIKESIKFLVKYFVRRNLTDSPGTRKLDGIFIDLVKECEENRKDLDINVIINFLSHPNRFSPLDTFIEKLKGNVYEINRDATRFILTSIEEKNQTIREGANLWERDEKDKLKWTIEHILPRTENLPKHWIDEISDGNRHKALKIQEDYVHTLGNLTLSGYNAKLGTKSFIEKRDHKNDKGVPDGFRNGLFLNKDLKDKKQWKKEDIKERTNRLSKHVIELFRIEGID